MSAPTVIITVEIPAAAVQVVSVAVPAVGLPATPAVPVQVVAPAPAAVQVTTPAVGIIPDRSGLTAADSTIASNWKIVTDLVIN